MTKESLPRFTYDPRGFQGAYYYERGLLSCFMAGAAIPPDIAADILLLPRHRVILEALRELERAGIRGNLEALVIWLGKTGTLEAAGGEDYIREIENMIGLPSAAAGFALEVRLLALARLS
jgi:hypothetical protein